jgi:HTH-type transcriptional regulator, transcriptional repressor of NAD biosynthesis genes
MEEKLRQQPSNGLRVVLFGPESTGKTVLAEQLAAHFNTVWTPEFSRLYAEAKIAKNESLSYEDVLPIAIGQMALENAMILKANNLLFCDTNLLETKVYSEFYYDGKCPEIIQKFALEHRYDLHFLTYIDLPWEADNIRDKPMERKEMFVAFEQALIMNKKPYVLLKGTMKERFDTAVKHIHQLIEIQ